MDISYFKNVKKGVSDYIDLETYTEVETQLGDDMFHGYKHHDKIYEPLPEKEFMKDVKEEHRDLRSNAM